MWRSVVMAAALMPAIATAASTTDGIWQRAGETALVARTLKNAMEAEGFDVYVNEWWHFDYGEWRQYPVMNVDFSGL